MELLITRKSCSFNLFQLFEEIQPTSGFFDHIAKPNIVSTEPLLVPKVAF